MKSYRIISAERLQRVLAGSGRNVALNLQLVREKRDLAAKLRLAERENAALLLENQALHDQRKVPPTPGAPGSARILQLEQALHQAKEHARLLDERVQQLTTASEAALRDRRSVPAAPVPRSARIAQLEQELHRAKEHARLLDERVQQLTEASVATDRQLLAASQAAAGLAVAS
ncbi:hypothetical protein ACEZCY_14455 [Streptacidiphilus sp. N1-12]|uniref:Uncharacterized protein n=2 Tax=Streptacidiphilus alkalitolerans TaxID=3342712 RepID=A0ABV6WEF7_9ACTN